MRNGLAWWPAPDTERQKRLRAWFPDILVRCPIHAPPAIRRDAPPNRARVTLRSTFLGKTEAYQLIKSGDAYSRGELAFHEKDATFKPHLFQCPALGFVEDVAHE